MVVVVPHKHISRSESESSQTILQSGSFPGSQVRNSGFLAHGWNCFMRTWSSLTDCAEDELKWTRNSIFKASPGLSHFLFANIESLLNVLLLWSHFAFTNLF